MPIKKVYPSVEVTSRAQWRDWLAANHTQASPVWLVTYKKHCPDRYTPRDAVVSEALCFGWIDSLPRRVDEDRTAVLVSPRRPGSAWSARNKVHVARLQAAGQLTPAGQARIDDVEARIVPPDLGAALADAGARAQWDALPNSTQKITLTWIKQAKRTPTRLRRIRETVEKTARGERPR